MDGQVFLLSKSDCIIIFIHHATWYCAYYIHTCHTQKVHMTNSKNMHLTITRKVGAGISMEYFGVLWVWEFCGNSHGFFFCGNGRGMGIEIQFPRQPWLLRPWLSQRGRMGRPPPSTSVIKIIKCLPILFTILWRFMCKCNFMRFHASLSAFNSCLEMGDFYCLV